MPAPSPILKIASVFIVCLGFLYAHYLMFHSYDFSKALLTSSFLLIPGFLYLTVIVFFAQYFFRKKLVLILIVWLIFNAALLANFFIYLTGYSPPLTLQYSQSTSLVVYTILLAFSKDKFPNWLRIFSLSCLLILIPCLIFYFAKMWEYYEITTYVLCITPVIKSFVFLKEIKQQNSDILDA